MATRQGAALLAVVVLLSTGIGFAFGQLGNENAEAAGGGTSAEVKQLKKVNRELGSLSTGLTALKAEVTATKTEVSGVEAEVSGLRATVGTSSFDGGSIFRTLYETCQAAKKTAGDSVFEC